MYHHTPCLDVVFHFSFVNLICHPFSFGTWLTICFFLAIIRAKRVSNCYIQKKKTVCSTNLGFSGEKTCACVRLILVLVWGTYYVPDTYVPHFMIPGRYYVPDTYHTRYVLCTRYVCTTLAVVLLIVQLSICLFVSGWWYARYLRSAQETAVSLFVYSLVGGGCLLYTSPSPRD